MKTKVPTFSYERRYLKRYAYVAGVDEAGVAPLAGPVVAAAVILNPQRIIGIRAKERWWLEVRDSKLLSRNKREEIARIVFKNCLSFGIGSSSVEEIDRINILQARLLAMKRAVKSLKRNPEFILVDGHIKIPDILPPQKAVVRGDEKILSVACASVLAKVTRDGILKQLHKKFPEYGFDQHKGYPTKLHHARLKQFGPCEVHRKTFTPVKELLIKS